MVHSSASVRVLLLSDCFPPDPVVGSLRTAKIAGALAEAGHQVQVVTSRLPGEVKGTRIAGRGITIHTVRAIPHPRMAYLLAKRWLGRTDASSGSPPPELFATAIPRWKRYLVSLFLLPDDRQGFIPPAVLACLQIHRRCSGVDLVYTTAPPFSVHVAGLVFKWLTGVKWAAEFRDPWTDNPAKSVRVRTGLSDAIERHLERWCLKTADRVVSATDAIHELLVCKEAPRPGQRFVVARNGIDRLAPRSRSAPIAEPFRIVHTGSLYHGRDPRPFLRALASLRERGRLSDREVLVEFVGDSRWFHNVSVEQLVQDLGLSATVHFLDWVPHRVCLEIIEHAHLLLLLAQDQPAQVPNKLFEYLGARKPILAFADAHGEVARMLRRVGNHYLVAQDDPALAETVLDRALRDLRAAGGMHTEEDVLREWTTQHQMEQLLLALPG